MKYSAIEDIVIKSIQDLPSILMKQASLGRTVVFAELRIPHRINFEIMINRVNRVLQSWDINPIELDQGIFFSYYSTNRSNTTYVVLYTGSIPHMEYHFKRHFKDDSKLIRVKLL